MIRPDVTSLHNTVERMFLMVVFDLTMDFILMMTLRLNPETAKISQVKVIPHILCAGLNGFVFFIGESSGITAEKPPQ